MIEAMHGMGVDTLKAARTLEKAGFEPAQAEALVAAFGGSVAGGAATREDLRDLRSASREDNRALSEDIAEVRAELKGDIAELRAGAEGGYRGAAHGTEGGYRGAAHGTEGGYRGVARGDACGVRGGAGRDADGIRFDARGNGCHESRHRRPQDRAREGPKRLSRRHQEPEGADVRSSPRTGHTDRGAGRGVTAAAVIPLRHRMVRQPTPPTLSAAAPATAPPPATPRQPAPSPTPSRPSPAPAPRTPRTTMLRSGRRHGRRRCR